MDMKNITFDLETLGNTSQAPIVQIGAVKFDENGDWESQFIRNIKMESLDRYNFHVDYRTVKWWLSQDDAAIKSVFCNEDEIDLRLALIEFHEWIGNPSKYAFWSHATFDPPILSNNIKQVGLEDFIPFRNHRDIRTLVHFTGKIDVQREGIHHNALDDCLFQAKYIAEGLKRINN